MLIPGYKMAPAKERLRVWRRIQRPATAVLSTLIPKLLIPKRYLLAKQRFQNRPSLSDEEFCRLCGIADDARRRQIVSITRRTLGTCSGLFFKKLYPDDTFGDPVWDSIDWLDILFRLEKATGLYLMRQGIRPTYPWSDLKVRDVVEGVLSALDAPQPMSRKRR
jgi:hypothetical protein